jgi:hypothetical protein
MDLFKITRTTFSYKERVINTIDSLIGIYMEIQYSIDIFKNRFSKEEAMEQIKFNFLSI